METVIEIRHYVDRAGRDVFDEWLTRLRDARAQAKIAVRINRLAAGNFGDSKVLRGGVSELRIDWGPGYRVYYAMVGREWVLLLAVATNGRNPAMVSARRCIERLSRKDGRLMKRKASVSHDEAIVRRIRKDPLFAEGKKQLEGGIGGRR